jgi:hypothetical protein
MANEFQYRGQLNGAENPVVRKILIGNSAAIVVGRAAKMVVLGSGGGVTPATAGSRIVGFVIGIVDSNGIDLDNTKQTLDGTWATSTQTYTAAADNMTVKKVAALVVVDKNALWYNDTAGDLVVADEYKFFDLSTAAQVADQNGHDSAGALVLVQRDPDGDGDASKGIFKIAESNLDPYAQV